MKLRLSGQHRKVTTLVFLFIGSDAMRIEQEENAEESSEPDGGVHRPSDEHVQEAGAAGPFFSLR